MCDVEHGVVFDELMFSGKVEISFEGWRSFRVKRTCIPPPPLPFPNENEARSVSMCVRVVVCVCYVCFGRV